jgi:zinc/manganese transport system substrate-binding protein
MSRPSPSRFAMNRLVTAGIVLLSVLASGLLAGCATTPPAGSGGGSGGSAGPIPVAASINAWGSVLAQLGGDRVRETSIITNPDTDPHDYEPTPADGRTIADSRLFLENGIGYDSWADRALSASPNPDRTVLDVGKLTGVPDGGNPHRWYSPADVDTVADAITAALKHLDPAGSAYYDQRRTQFAGTGLAEYHRLIAEIRSRYAGTPIGASESIVSPLSDALGLKMLTPASFLKAISEGTDPSAADKSAIDAQISGHQIKVYVFNSQNSTPDVSAQVNAARAAGIPVSTLTETLAPAGTTFQDWQTDQLRRLEDALRQGTGR